MMGNEPRDWKVARTRRQECCSVETFRLCTDNLRAMWNSRPTAASFSPLNGTTVRVANVSYGATDLWRAWEAHKD